MLKGAVFLHPFRRKAPRMVQTGAFILCAGDAAITVWRGGVHSAAARRGSDERSEAGRRQTKSPAGMLTFPAGFLDGFTGVHQSYSVLPAFVFHTGGGSKPPPYEIGYRFFRTVMFRAHILRKSLRTSFASRGVGAQSPRGTLLRESKCEILRVNPPADFCGFPGRRNA